MWSPPKDRTSLQIFVDVTFALLLREVKTRFGDRKFGYLWVLVEPILLITFLSIAFSFRGREALGDTEYAVFVMLGLVPLFFFRKGTTSAMKAIKPNKGLFVYPVVRPFNAIAARILLELMICVALLVIFALGFWWLGMGHMPRDIGGVMGVLGVLLVMTSGLGFLLCVINNYIPSVTSFWSMISMPLMILSGAVIPVFIVIPPQYHDWLLLNPVLHCFELIRYYWVDGYPLYVQASESWLYASSVALVMLFLGLYGYRVTWRKMVAS
ncbi:ABC transporter permease [Vibrio barjaei]|uniref:ABC transporter permease n=1 Tax=Vibrio barjaei TaxID=1676683 RepID=UPI00228518B1|nr:ABC transporter permease [Vibrio barjaei]MCY9872375.1 ABC transporter permease [Vibrio barjaei]